MVRLISACNFHENLHMLLIPHTFQMKKKLANITKSTYWKKHTPFHFRKLFETLLRFNIPQFYIRILMTMEKCLNKLNID